jgi:ABC-2 type transport system ATP-binding protein
MSLAINCRQLTKTYRGRPPVEAVRGLLDVHVGECFGSPAQTAPARRRPWRSSKASSRDGRRVEILGCVGKRMATIRRRIGISLRDQAPDKPTVRGVTMFDPSIQQARSDDAVARVSWK